MRYLNQFVTRLTAPFRLLLASPFRLINAPQKLMGMSLPARVAIFLATFLIILSVIAFVQFVRVGDSSDWRVWTKNILGIITLIGAITAATYWALRLWLEGDRSRFPDIDQAWEQGLQALRENGIDLFDVPLFWILGAPDEGHVDALMDASGCEFAVSAIPAGRNPIRWYADQRGRVSGLSWTWIVGSSQPSSGHCNGARGRGR